MRGRYLDRAEAGRALADAVESLLATHPEMDDVVVLALPRGGVPVAMELARRLGAPLDLVLVRKIGAPGNPELAAGAVADGGYPQRVVNADVVRITGMSEDDFAQAERRQLEEIERRRKLWLGDRPRAPVQGRDVIVVDDGLATGATMRAALHAMAAKGARTTTLAVPVAAPESLDSLQGEADHAVCPWTPSPFGAIGAFYENFSQVADEEVRALLDQAAGSGDGR